MTLLHPSAPARLGRRFGLAAVMLLAILGCRVAAAQSQGDLRRENERLRLLVD